MTSPGRRGFRVALVAIWALAALVYCWTHRHAIATHGFPDPDDAMRLQEVRDWLAGQSWFDVGQHRMNAPWGTTMHWSRLVDVPIAATILLLLPVLGAGGAETATLVIIPLATMLCVMLATGVAARRLLPERAALLAAAMVPLTVGAIQQLQPLRIDHHGWQMVAAVLMFAGLLDERPWRGGAVAGAAAAAWLAISLEGLPLAAATGGWLALRWLGSPSLDARRLTGFAGALSVLALLLLLLTRAPADWGLVACDALSAVHAVALLAATIGLLVTIRFAVTPASRIAGLAASAVAAALIYRLGAPQCVAGGAFAGMDPLVKRYWYDNVTEGLPVWRQSAALAVTGLGFPFVGVLGTWRAWRGASGEARARWLDALVFLAAAVAVALLVQRASAVAAIVALPGAAALLVRAVGAAQRVPASVARVPLTAAAALALLPTTPALVAASIAPADRGIRPSHCATTADYRAARALPRGILLTGIDIGPGLLVETDHAIVASGHHRNRAGMHDAIATFVESPEVAHAILRRRGVTYLVVCADMREMGIYADAAPDGLWAQLRRRRVPAWLEPVQLSGSRLGVWRVVG